MNVDQLMTRDVVCCSNRGTLVEPACAMWNKDIGFVPVVDATTNELVGVVTDRDICMAALTQGKPLHEIPIESAMQTHLHVCHEFDSIDRAHEIMRDSQVRRLPVLDAARRVVGVVALNDLALHADAIAGKDLRDAFIQTVGAICKGHAVAEERTFPAHAEVAYTAAGG